MRDDQNDSAAVGHNQPLGSKIVKPPRITKPDIDKLGNKQKFGKRAHVGLTFKMIDAFGGLQETLGRQEPAPFFEQIYQPDEKELTSVRKATVVVDESDDNKRPPRTWREDRGQKIRCGQISVSVLEAKHMLYHLCVGIGQEAASIFTPEDMVRLHPSEIIDRILRAAPGLASPPQNPVLLLKLLAEFQSRATPQIDIVSGALHLTNQGDGRSDGLKVVTKSPVLVPGQAFFLDISYDDPRETQVYVFEYSLAALQKEGGEGDIVALPMPYLEASKSGVLVLNNDYKNLRATGEPGAYGFAAITWRSGKQDKEGPTLFSLLGEPASRGEWTRADLNAVIQVLRRELVQENPRVSLGLLDYVKG